MSTFGSGTAAVVVRQLDRILVCDILPQYPAAAPNTLAFLDDATRHIGPAWSIVCPAMRVRSGLVVKGRSRVDPWIWIGSTPPPLWIWPKIVSGVAVALHRSRFRDTCLALFNTRTTTCSDPACLRKELLTAFQVLLCWAEDLVTK